MQSAPLPENEEKRLQTLRQYEILDTLPEHEYDRITKLASIICGTPITLISIIDKDRQWFKSKVGLDASETPRNLAFCAHAILSPGELLVVGDTLNDQRFYDSPLVAGAPHIRFYAGAPLTVSTGDTLGTLCVIDTVPRELTDEQKIALGLLAEQVVSAIEMRSKKNELVALSKALEDSNRVKAREINERIATEMRLRELSEIHRLMVEYSPDLVFVKDERFRFVQANKALLQAFPEVTRDYIIGTTAMESFTPEEMEGYLANDRKAFAEGYSETIETANFGGERPTTLFTKKVRFTNENGEKFILGVARDITDIKEAEAALRQSNVLNNAILASAAHMIIAIDTQGKVLVFNNEAERLLGYQAKEIVGKQTPALWHKEQEIVARAQELNKLPGALVEPGLDVFTCNVLRDGSEEREWTFVAKNGSEFPGVMTVTALKDADHKVVGFLGLIRDVTESKRMLKELRISEERLFLASSGTSDGLWDWNIVTGNTYYSPRFEEMLGYAPGEMNCNSMEAFREQMHPDDREHVATVLKKHFTERIPHNVEYRVLNKRGDYVWLNARGQASWDEQDTPIRMTGFVTDITRRKEAEISERLHKMESTKLLATIDNAPDYIGMADLDGNLLYHNRAARLMIGLPEDADLSHLKISDMHPAWVTKIILTEALPSLYTKGVWRGETALLHRDGYEIAVSQMLTLYRNEEGVPVSIATIMQDISERKLWEEAMKVSEQTFRTAMEDSSIGMALVAPDGKWLRVNKALSDLIGYTEEELMKLDFQAITHPDDLSIDLEYLKQMLNREITTYNMEKRYIHKNGGIVWILLSVSLVWNADNQPKYFISQIQDINERREADATRQKLMEKLAESNTELERFAYVASHDMQEPLRMMANFSELVGTEYGDKLDKDGKEYIDIITNSARRMQAMVTDLLEYARIGNDATRFIPVDTNEEISHVLKNLSAAIRERNALVTYSEMPSVNGNPVQITRLLQNLIGNGLKYQLADTVPQVTVRVEDEGTYWRFCVKDNGIGMEPENAERIFAPFARLHTWAQYNGTGIGLAVCKKIVENHGGRIWVESQPGHGSSFYFTLPKLEAGASL